MVHLRICDVNTHLVHLKTRMPFRYGIATMTDVPQIFVRLEAEIDGRRVRGISADLLPPKWFTKIPEKAVSEEIDEMLAVIENAARLATGMTGSTAFEIWQHLHRLQASWGEEKQLPPLLTNFGTSLVERALIEAACRRAGLSLFRMLNEGRLGVELGRIHPELRDRKVAEFLESMPLQRVIVRHTVGLSDPLLDGDVAASERLEDGLPQSLESCIRAYGLQHFKIKVTGDWERDVGRLLAIARVLEREATPGYAFSLDGNEQFKRLDDFRNFWESLREQGTLQRFFDHLLFVEQPLHRDEALKPEVGSALARWPNHPPLIIDESDAALESLPVALQLGYSGTSHKNCKGVFKGIANHCLLAHRRSMNPAAGLLLSGEDLCTIGPVAVLQDLAVMGALGIRSVERNGHHYHAGLSQFPLRVQEQALHAHGDLYQRSRDGWPTLRIQEGEVELGSINRAAFGVGFELDFDSFQ